MTESDRGPLYYDPTHGYCIGPRPSPPREPRMSVVSESVGADPKPERCARCLLELGPHGYAIGSPDGNVCRSCVGLLKAIGYTIHQIASGDYKRPARGGIVR